MATELRVRVRLAGGQVATQWFRVEWISRPDGRVTAHLLLEGGHFFPPVELGSTLLVDLEQGGEAP